MQISKNNKILKFYSFRSFDRKIIIILQHQIAFMRSKSIDYSHNKTNKTFILSSYVYFIKKPRMKMYKKMLLDKNNNFDWPAKYLLRLKAYKHQWYLLSNCIIRSMCKTQMHKIIVLLDLNILSSLKGTDLSFAFCRKNFCSFYFFVMLDEKKLCTSSWALSVVRWLFL